MTAKPIDTPAEVLLPCPFCGGNVTTDVSETGGFFICADGGCKGSGLWTGFLGDQKETAIAAWNTRTPSPDVSGLVEALREVAEDLEAYVNAEYTIEIRDNHPSMERKYVRDMAPVTRARAELAKWESRA